MPKENWDQTIVTALLEDRHGTLWVGTQASGLYRRWPNGRAERYTTRDGLPDDHVLALLEDREGRLWVGVWNGLCRISPEHSSNQSSIITRVYTAKDGLSDNVVGSLLQSSDGRLWIGTAYGLSELDHQTGKHSPTFRTYTTANRLTKPVIQSLAEDGEGNIWVGTGGSGAMKLARNGFTTYNKSDGLISDDISSIFENRAGEICVFTSSYIHRFDGSRFTAIRPNYPEAITYFGWGWNQLGFQDHSGEWWVPTGQGLCRFPRVSKVEQLARARPKAVYTTRDGLAGDDVFRLFEDSRRDIWIATIHRLKNGLTRWERATGKFYRHSEADGRSAAHVFCEDRLGSIWIGSKDWLARYRHGRFTFFTAMRPYIR